MRQFIEMFLKDHPGKMKLVCRLEKSLLKMQMSLEVAAEGFLSLLSLLEHFSPSITLVNPPVYSQFLPSILLLVGASVFLFLSKCLQTLYISCF